MMVIIRISIVIFLVQRNTFIPYMFRLRQSVKCTQYKH